MKNQFLHTNCFAMSEINISLNKYPPSKGRRYSNNWTFKVNSVTDNAVDCLSKRLQNDVNFVLFTNITIVWLKKS